MATNLVIVESKGKVDSITKYLNSNPALKHLGTFNVVACFGHIKDLPSKKLGVDIDNNFEPQYEILPDKKQLVADLLAKAKKAKKVYLASDNDASGSYISQALREELKLGENYHRIIFTEITSQALERAVLNPGKINQNQVEGEKCRRIIDRLVGYKLSPLLWKKFSSGSVTLSAGRVQSALMHLIIERENEINAFKSTPYWHVQGNFTFNVKDAAANKDAPAILEEVRLYKDKTIYKDSEQAVLALFKKITNKFTISDIKARQTKQSPDAPFITSTLQQEASSKLRTSVKRVMQIAQTLYEAGHITYMRTDSFNMSDTFKSNAKPFISKTYGEDYYSGGILKKAGKSAQEAHECIRITDPNLQELPAKHSKDEKELYKLIWQRTIAYLLKPAMYDELDLEIQDAGMPKDYKFITTFKKVKYNGYLIVYGIKSDTSSFDNYMKTVKAGKYDLQCQQLIAKNTWTSPPARYNDAGLVKLMEINQIGRPATMSTIIEKLYEKTYVIKTDIKGESKPTTEYEFKPAGKALKKVPGTTQVGEEKSKVKPTDIGLEIDKYLSEHFDYIVDTQFTATMETDLDLITEGDKTRQQVLSTFWKQLSKDLDTETAKKESKREVKSETREIKLNNTTYTIRLGPYGPMVEYMKDNKKTYIGLKGYLSFIKKEYLDVTEEDIKYLLELPKVIGKVNNKDVMLQVGPYGPYLKHDNKNVKIPRFALKEFAETRTLTLEQIKGFIEYASKSAPKANSAPAAASKKATPATKKKTPAKKKTPTK